MRVAGVDPSIADCGIVVLSIEGARTRLLSARTLHPPVGWTDQERVAWLALEVTGIIANEDVEVAGVEAQHAGACRANTLVKLCMAAGAVCGACGAMQVPVYGVQPTEARKALGFGAMKRDAVNAAVARRLGLAKALPEHESAAVAVALAAASRHRAAVARGEAAR